ncbi:MAG: DUF4382 domain-containing protein [Calditrichia bacterium]|nr:DUF4382 domain-containing protein [Calditrichia bacterium]
MKNKIYLLGIIISLLIFFMQCEKNSSNVGDEGAGTVRFLLTDAPGEFDSVKISFSNMAAHIDSDWVEISGDPQTIDLLTLANGNFMVLGEGELGAGLYSQIRLFVDSASIGVDGQVYPLEIPSNINTGLKLVHQFTINEGATYELVLDFDVNRSIVIMGPPHNPHGYKLKPTIRVITRAVTGSIFGTVTNFENLPIAYAMQGTDTVTSTIVNGEDGFFRLAFLEEGDYQVIVNDTLDLEFIQDPVQVTPGSDFDLGSITLQ